MINFIHHFIVIFRDLNFFQGIDSMNVYTTFHVAVGGLHQCVSRCTGQRIPLYSRKRDLYLCETLGFSNLTLHTLYVVEFQFNILTRLILIGKVGKM